MKTLFRSICIALFLCSLPAWADGPSWEFAGWYGGGCFPNIAFDPHNRNRVYMTSDVAGIYRSDDLGDHWYFVTKGLGNMTVSQIAIAPSDSNVLYAATKKGIFVSKDTALSWQAADTAKGAIRFDRPANYRSIAVSTGEPNHLCVGTAKGRIFCSKNYGESWTDIDPAKTLGDAKPVTALAFDGSMKFIYAATHQGLSRCNIDETGCALTSQSPHKVTDFEFSKKFPQTIYSAGEKALWISRDAGVTWEQLSPIPKGNTFRVTVDESGDHPVIRAIWNKDWDGGVLVSKDEGVTWESQDHNFNADMIYAPAHAWVKNGGRSTVIKIDPFNVDVIFRGDFFGVWRSDDAGASWNEKVVGAPNTVATDLAFSPDGDLLVASMDNGLLRSADKGKHYQMLFPLKYDDNKAGHVWRVALAGDTIVGTSSPWNRSVNQVLISSDGGKTFEMVHNGLPEGRPKKNTLWGQGYPRALAVDPTNPDIIYLGIDGDDGGGLFISHDRGRSWQRSVGQPHSLRIYNGLAVDPTNTRRIIWGASGKNGGVYISEDAGQSFEYSLKEMQWINDVKVASNGAIFAAGDSNGAKLFMSSNHGRSWKMAGDFGPRRALGTVAVNPANPKRVAVSTVSWGNEAPCKIHLSDDGGKTWKDITGDLPDGAGASSMTFDPEGNYLYISRYAGSVYRLKI